MDDLEFYLLKIQSWYRHHYRANGNHTKPEPTYEKIIRQEKLKKLENLNNE